MVVYKQTDRQTEREREKSRYIDVYTYIHTDICTPLSLCMYVCTYVSMCVNMHICMHYVLVGFVIWIPLGMQVSFAHVHTPIHVHFYKTDVTLLGSLPGEVLAIL